MKGSETLKRPKIYKGEYRLVRELGREEKDGMPYMMQNNYRKIRHYPKLSKHIYKYTSLIIW